MKIVAPISKVEEARVFARVGADELYFGVVPEEWVKQYGRFTPNRRGANNLKSLEEVKQVVDTVHGLGKCVSVAMNGATHTTKQIEYITSLATELATLSVDALIVGDIQLLYLLNRLDLPVKLHVSSIAACRNIAAAHLYHKLGADRIILPRHISLKEICTLVRAVPELEFEAFVLNDGCPYEEGLCHTLHMPNNLGGPICFEMVDAEYQRGDGLPMTTNEKRELDKNEKCYAHWRWSKFSRGFSETSTGQPYGPCGLCAIPDFNEIGIDYIKIAGRDGNSLRKRRSLDMVNDILAHLDRGCDPDEVINYAQHVRGEPDLCRDGQMCYYPEVIAKENR